MAVVTLYMSDRDTQKTFTDKKEAENYDRKLELAANVSTWMKDQIQGLSDEQSTAIGLLVADNKDLLAKALKGKSDVLVQANQTAETGDTITSGPSEEKEEEPKEEEKE